VGIANAEHDSTPPLDAIYSDTVSYFNFTKSKTKIAHTPTVTGNITNCVSRNAPPLGTAKVSSNIAKAVSIPRTNLVLEFMLVHPARTNQVAQDRRRQSQFTNGPPIFNAAGLSSRAKSPGVIHCLRSTPRLLGGIST
jgi:hypothetical protein